MSYFYYQSKRIYYTESGNGAPVLFLHGNTASSKMFELLLPLYEEDVYKRQDHRFQIRGLDLVQMYGVVEFLRKMVSV